MPGGDGGAGHRRGGRRSGPPPTLGDPFGNIRDGARIHARRASWGARGEVGLAASGFADRRLRGSDPAGWLGTRRVRRPERDRRSVALAVAGGALLALAGSGCAFGSPSQVGGVRGASTSATPGGPGGAAAVTPAGSAPSGAASTAGASASLQGVACVAAADCWAVGWSTADTAGQPETLIAQDTGAGWRVLASPPVPGSAGAELDAVTCAGDGDCWAVGYSWQGSGAARTTQPLVERETPAGGWTTVSSPAPTGVPDSALDGVACAANGDCWAVGYSSASTAAGARYRGGTTPCRASRTSLARATRWRHIESSAARCRRPRRG